MKLQLTDKLVRLISKRDRRALGLKTQDEISTAVEIKTERELHKQVAALLRLRDVAFFESRMDKRTGRPKGEPDFLFCIAYKPNDNKTTASLLTWPIAIGWELKLPGKKLDPEQQAMFARMTAAPNGWQCCVISSVDQALDELKKLGL